MWIKKLFIWSLVFKMTLSTVMVVLLMVYYFHIAASYEMVPRYWILGLLLIPGLVVSFVIRRQGLKDRIIKIEGGKYWFIPKFIDFQYGRELRSSNTAVRSVIEVLKKYELLEYLSKTKIIEGATKELTSSLQAVKDKDKEKDKVKEKEEYPFDEFWNLYD